ncbi:hypothetical protein O181_120479 [Austropuccinia psidii MF-1]|uniref:Uncharacterized protein n=1 Tax=Austropuccinia psidii MF-1 TaxID=1389203 RepID=A0A9Q3KJ74_9BASI|nr:hypothetical protein [Austropuccinia psidii MF-1]
MEARWGRMQEQQNEANQPAWDVLAKIIGGEGKHGSFQISPMENHMSETQLFTLFGEPNEVRKAGQELGNLKMSKSDHVCLYKLEKLKVNNWRLGERVCIEEDKHQGYWISLTAFKNSWMLLWSWIPGTMRGKRKRVVTSHWFQSLKASSRLIFKKASP